jgi:hypothetical protein
MELMDEETQRQKSTCRSTGQVRGAGSERSKETGQQREWPQRRSGQEPQENSGRETQCAPAKAWSPQRLNLLIEAIRARFGEYAIGRGDHGAHFLVSR